MNPQLIAQRQARMTRLAQAHPERFCYLDLYDGARGMTYVGWLHDAQDARAECEDEVRARGRCYCGALRQHQTRQYRIALEGDDSR